MIGAALSYLKDQWNFFTEKKLNFHEIPNLRYFRIRKVIFWNAAVNFFCLILKKENISLGLLEFEHFTLHSFELFYSHNSFCILSDFFPYLVKQ
jgi:hypothetical protein